MEAFRYHVFVCNQKKPEGAPSCSARGSEAVIEALRREIMAQGLANDVQVTTCGSIGLCERGPNMIVYPDGVWYSGLTHENISEIVREHLKAGRVVQRLLNSDVKALRSEIDTNKGKMMAAMKARDEAGVIPDDLMQTIQGFRPSRIVLTAVELDIFTAIGDGATAADVAAKLTLAARSTEALLNALTALDLLIKRDGIFSNTPVAARFLAAGGKDFSRDSLMHTVNLWDRWSTLTGAVREGTSVVFREQAVRPRQDTEAFIAAMDKNAGFRAPMVVRTLTLNNVKRVLDVGGGSGAYSIALARAKADIRAEIFDLPTVTPLAQKYIKDAGLSDRISTRDGDMRTDDLGTGYDLVLLSAICHMNSPEENIKLFAKCLAALNSGGQIVMQDFVLSPDKTSPQSGALFAINMLVGTRSGSSYSEDEYRRWLEHAGFIDIKKVQLPGPTALMIGRRP
jgi:(2Fe-2S) ferredoxin/predicted O-methyltransferase YrrM